jgi:hypothetical protein
LGIQAQFRSLLDGLKIKSGEYGLRLRIEIERPDLEDIKNLPKAEKQKYLIYKIAEKYIQEE